jgi:Na+/glutamate symporter
LGFDTVLKLAAWGICVVIALQVIFLLCLSDNWLRFFIAEYNADNIRSNGTCGFGCVASPEKVIIES